MRFHLAAALAVLATPALAEAPQRGAALQAKNADVLLSKYPPGALAAGQQGSVYFKLELDPKGNPKSCQVVSGSGHALLDEATCDVVLRYAVFQPPSSLSGLHGTSTHDGVVNWRIPGAPPLPAPPALLQTTAELPAKKVCKRSVRIGTLSGFERTCMTKREWLRARDDIVEPWDEIQGRRGFTNGRT